MGVRLSTRTGILIASAVALLATSCGGDGGSPYQLPGTRPSISNLVIAPVSAMQNEGAGLVSVNISVDFVDQEGDVNYMGIHVLDSRRVVLYLTGELLPGLAGQMSGTAHATIQIATDTVGEFTVRVWLVDASIRDSNRLETPFSVI